MVVWVTPVLLLRGRARRIPPAWGGCEQDNHSQLLQAPHPGKGIGLDGADGVVPQVPAGTTTGRVSKGDAMAGTQPLTLI